MHGFNHLTLALVLALGATALATSGCEVNSSTSESSLSDPPTTAGAEEPGDDVGGGSAALQSASSEEAEDADDAVDEAHPHGGPPGQTGEHPQGGPPGQADEEGDHDRGHGNDPDGQDPDNPGRGGGPKG